MSEDNLLRLASLLDRNSWDATCRSQDSGTIAQDRETRSWPRRSWAALRKELQRFHFPGCDHGRPPASR